MKMSYGNNYENFHHGRVLWPRGVQQAIVFAKGKKQETVASGEGIAYAINASSRF